MKSILKKAAAYTLLMALLVGTMGCSGSKKTETAATESNLGNTYPLNTDEKLVWATWTGSHSDYLDYKQQPFFKGLIEQTGVDIDFKFDVVGESFNLMLASGELPDVIQYDWYNIKGGPEKQIEDGVIIDLTEPIKKWAPNLKKYLEEHPDGARDLKADSGKYYVFPFLRGDEKLTVYEGMMVRKDYLDKYNLVVPETIDEWENAFKVMKDNGVKIPFSFEGNNCKPIMTAYNLTDSFMNTQIVKDVPIWEKYLLTIKEAAQYFNIGENKLYRIVNEYGDIEHTFIVQNGNRTMINRRKFENFLNELTAI